MSDSDTVDAQPPGRGPEFATMVGMPSLSIQRPEVQVVGMLTSCEKPLDPPSEVNPGVFLIGRDPSAKLKDQHISVSRLHAKIVADGGQFRIIDLDSRNGTYVNSVPVQECPLHDGDQLQIGQSKYWFNREIRLKSPMAKE
jgi:hypothetical protein